ncbi:E3 ubiquitin-protein ligase MYLIP [Cryptotermes secundus]|uniref:RING-type E3 ubiquitin transferase n=1 Tax=Cryptotermes secundus TaxID=105785 RepID=A0A2J7PED5_9NEOP|nr:E3 ubiquitin-protein ligase MYLIP [Cryptotermes secundus]PNF14672.1 E3 ubiquitin-protein ligase MYLIP [Cryptotermes secundus]
MGLANRTRMWCLVSQPNCVIIEVKVDPKAEGQECLEKVCHCLGISTESDYFGLKYHGAKGEELWLNLRNPIERQVVGLPPYRFALRVKFWVPPHLLLQDSTRHQFYLHARLDVLEGRLKVNDWSITTKFLALMVQAECGDFEPLTSQQHHCKYLEQCSQLCGVEDIKPSDVLHRVSLEHQELKGMKPSAAEYWLLKEASYLDSFGEELFHSKPSGEGCIATCLGVGPHGISLYHGEDLAQKHSIPYTAIQTAASQRRLFHLTYADMDGHEASLEIKLESSQAASGVYRAITEKHAFYSCETVRSAVTTQFIRDLKGTIVSIFNEDTSLGKKYVFDIRRTCREVYDNARRASYRNSGNVGMSQIFPSTSDVNSANISTEGRSQNENGERVISSGCVDEQCKSTQARLARLLEAMSCRICMDRAIDTAFFPCAHVMACGECGARCDRCPLCRAPIQHSQHIFLPIELQDTDSLLQQHKDSRQPKEEFEGCDDDDDFHEEFQNRSPQSHQQHWQYRNDLSQREGHIIGVNQVNSGTDHMLYQMEQVNQSQENCMIADS